MDVLRHELGFLWTFQVLAGIPNSQWTCCDLGLRVAMIALWPGKIKAGSTTDAMVNYVDVVPTILDLLGGDPG